MPSSPAGRRSCLSTSSPTPTRRAAAIPSATSMSRKSWTTASTSTSTVNIQHIESLNDVVAQITRVRVRETVPDSIFDRADSVELIDLTPEDLIARLKDGKVYVPKQAERALEHFFSPANLTALRELALRRTAERVDEQLLAQMRARAIAGPWPAGERVLVCVSEDPARRRAGALRQAPGRSPACAMDGALRRNARAACS